MAQKLILSVLCLPKISCDHYGLLIKSLELKVVLMVMLIWGLALVG